MPHGPDHFNLFAQQDATADPARSAGGEPAQPFTLDALRGSPGGVILETLLGATPAGVAMDVGEAGLAASRGDIPTALAAGAGVIPGLGLLGDILKRFRKAGGDDAAQSTFRMARTPTETFSSPQEVMGEMRDVRALLGAGRDDEAKDFMMAVIRGERTPLTEVQDRLPRTLGSARAGAIANSLRSLIR